MKINLDYDGYDIKSLSEIHSGAATLQKRCEILLECEEDMRAQIDQAKIDFDTANYDKVYEVMNSFKKKVAEFSEDLKDLIESVEAYREDIERRWR